ncbi:hypothetical protein KDH_17820 [Dictyobacter sp. S3.2.2.5]|uniref:Uncharacterized protein n=1 Tax=Dictyobacter halimunensis TaxID=3026934 RepID=A0ABQ6FMU5_9CHLR|nr:hypothetical protein KDH_17820 [Dictyobacter sp. S3.2.2.5]
MRSCRTNQQNLSNYVNVWSARMRSCRTNQQNLSNYVNVWSAQMRTPYVNIKNHCGRVADARAGTLTPGKKCV